MKTLGGNLKLGDCDHLNSLDNPKVASVKLPDHRRMAIALEADAIHCNIFGVEDVTVVLSMNKWMLQICLDTRGFQ